MKEFEVKREHLELLQNLCIGEYDSTPCIDAKRPFGNSNITYDIAELIGIYSEDLTEQEEQYCNQLYADMTNVLQILTQNLKIHIGTYVNQHSSPYSRPSWRLK